MTKEEFLKIELNQISQCYLGKDNCCRCGCGGEYTATSFMNNPRSKVDDLSVLKKLSRAKKLAKNEGLFVFSGNHVNIKTGKNRALTFYFDELI